MLDSKSLSSYLYIVKNLVKSKKFIILVPLAVLSDLDEIKKISEGARNAIKWLESQLQAGSRYLRSQKSSETLPLSLKLKVSKKLGKKNLIVAFC